MHVHACNIGRLRAERPNWLPDLISLREDEHKYLDHQQLVLSSKGVTEPAAQRASRSELETRLTFSCHTTREGSRESGNRG